MKDIEKLYSACDYSIMDVERMPKDYIVKQLFRHICGYMIDNKDELPAEIMITNNPPKREFDPNPPTVNYRLRINIISTEELDRLQDIERKYDKLLKDKEE